MNTPTIKPDKPYVVGKPVSLPETTTHTTLPPTQIVIPSTKGFDPIRGIVLDEAMC